MPIIRRLVVVLVLMGGAAAADAVPASTPVEPPAMAPPKGFRSVTPYLYVDDAKAAIAYYVKAFDAEELYAYPNDDGGVIHAEIRIGEASIMIADAAIRADTSGPMVAAPRSAAVHLYVRDVDAVFAQAVAAGGTEMTPPTDMPWGHRFAMIKDPYGHTWSMATPGDDAPAAEAEGRIDEAGGAKPDAPAGGTGF